MRSTIRKRTYLAIYRLLDRVSPIDGDCGLLCGSACCMGGHAGDPGSGDDSNGNPVGIYLLPGEEKVHSKHDEWLDWAEDDADDYDFPDSWTGKVYFINCKTPPYCPREKRPLQCRTFPLTPHLDENDELSLVYNDLELPYACPLIYEAIPLNDDFVKATLTVWKHLVRDPLIYDLVKMDSLERE